MMEHSKGLTNLQMELLKIFSYNLSEHQLMEIKSLLSKYFSEKATVEMDKLWDEKGWDNNLMDEWSKEHLRANSKK
jgi:hypothetical protein